MNENLNIGNFSLIHGDCLHVMTDMDSCSVDLTITSPLMTTYASIMGIVLILKI